MRQILGQQDIFTYVQERDRSTWGGCGSCICRSCLYWWSDRCPHGKCWDDHRAKVEPYDKAHPDKPQRIGWGNWRTDQAYWCRGGAFYPVHYCGDFVKYTGSTVEDCVSAPVQTFQDGYIACTLMSQIGCEECIRQSEGREARNQFSCSHMTETGCEEHIAAVSRMLDDIAAGSGDEPCREQCCIGCKRNCRYRCGWK